MSAITFTDVIKNDKRNVSMAERNQSTNNGLKLFIYWLVVGIPLAWGIWNTLLKLPALFKEFAEPFDKFSLTIQRHPVTGQRAPSGFRLNNF